MKKVREFLLKIFFIKNGQAPYSKIYYTSRKFVFPKIRLEETNNKRYLRELCIPWFDEKKIGFLFYDNGKISSMGILQRAGLYIGIAFWRNGKKKFKGICNDKKYSSGYYGPSYPIYGYFYNEKGEKVYKGEFYITSGGVGYPTVTMPKEFESITW